MSCPTLGRRRPGHHGDTIGSIPVLPRVGDSPSAASQEGSFANSWKGRGGQGSMSDVKAWVAFLVCPDVPLHAASEVPFEEKQKCPCDVQA